jgi:hypothetical protein
MSAPPILKILSAVLVVLTGVVLYSMIAFRFSAEGFRYFGTLLLASLGIVAVFILMGIVAAFYRKH